MRMLWLAASAAIATAGLAPSASVRAVVQATATVRIISGVRLNLSSATNKDAPPAHDSVITASGSRQPARLIEFE